MIYYKILLLQVLFSVVDSRLWHSQKTGCNQPVVHQVEHLKAPREASANIKMKDKIELRLYYETLCPASVEFIVTQLKPVVKTLGSHLDIHLIPYGHATTRRHLGRYVFNCQHGIAECHGNTVHACAVDVLRNSTLAVLFNSCLMEYTTYNNDYEYFVSTFNWCGYREGVPLHNIFRCVNSKRGSYLVKSYGDETQHLHPKYVPYVLLDGSPDYQDQASRNLFRTVCQLLVPTPPACFYYT